MNHESHLIRRISAGGVVTTCAESPDQLGSTDGTAAGAVIASNDNGETGLATAFTQVGAFPLTAGSRDAALLVTLDAGLSYAVQVDGIGGTTGEALIEIYEAF